MTAIVATGAAGPAWTPVCSEAAAVPPVLSLPEPLVSGWDAPDALSMMLMAMERMSQMSTTQSEKRVVEAKKDLHVQLQRFMEQLRAAMEAARKAKEEAAKKDDGGLFGDIVDVVSDVAGSAADFAVDYIRMPADVVVGVASNLKNPKAMLDVVSTEFTQLVEDSEVAESVQGFSKGALHFAVSLTNFSVELLAAIAKAAVTGEDVWEAVKGEAKELWASLEANILNNPAFWEVLGPAVKIASVAAAVASGGVLAFAAVALFALDEADNKYGFIKDVVGEEAAPWVKAGVQAGMGVCAGLACSGELAPVLRMIQGGAAVAQGGNAMYQAHRAEQAGHRLADEMDRAAELKETMNRMQQVQRLIEALLAQLGEDSDDQKTTREIGFGLVQTQAAASAAVIMRA